ncbi:UNVERIFIED_CONTAM: hypothetical protein RMT77_018134 [Armadillidium vulgare]
MNIKSESEIKIEELDLEYDSYKQNSQIFSDIESDFTLKAEDIEIEELDENASIKSELTESEKESVLDEGLVNNGVIKSENVMMIEKKSFGQHSKSFPHIESIIPLPECIKKELDENSSFIKSEPRESDLEFVFNEEKLENDVIKSENSPMKMGVHKRTLIINSAEEEKDLEGQSTSKRKPQRAVVHKKKNIMRKISVADFVKISFKRKDELKTHLKTYNKRKFKCAHCSYESNFKSVLKRHMLTHSNIKLYKCSDCSYECNRKGYLRIHMLTHANVKLFKCSDCSYECNQRRHLKRHIYSHGVYVHLVDGGGAPQNMKDRGWFFD